MGNRLSRFSRWRGYGAGYRLLVMALLGTALALAGGASRPDEDQQPLVRCAAILAIAATLWPLEFDALRRRWRTAAAVGAVYLLMLLQLVPLPPALWAALPGHAVYAQIAQAAGVVVWRPLSLTPDLTLNALGALLPATAAALTALHLDFRGRVRLAQAVVIVACLSGLLGLAQLAVGGGWRLYRETSADSAVGLFANRNHQAALMACALPLTGAIAGLRLRERGDHRLIPILGAAVAAFLTLALISTGSRMGLALGVVGLAGGAWAYRLCGQRLWPLAPIARWATAGGAIVLLAVIGLAAARGGAVERLSVQEIVSETRVAMIRPLLDTTKAFLPLGAGFGAFDSVYRRFEPNALLSTIYMNQAHDEPLQLAIEGGVAALALLALFLIWWARTTWRAARSAPSGRRRAMAAAATTVTAILMASSLVDYPLRTPLLGALFAVACVELALSAEKRSASEEPA